MDKVSPKKSRYDHMNEDVIPFIECCVKGSNCAAYYEKRPPHPGNQPERQPPGK